MADKVNPTPSSAQYEERKEGTEKTNVGAGKTPRQGSSMGAAYFETLAAGRHNSLKSNIDTSKVQTNAMLEKAAEARAQQALLAGNYSPSHILKNTGFEIKASFYESLAKYKNNKPNHIQSLENSVSSVANKAQGALAAHDDMGTQTAGGVIKAGTTAYEGFKAAQKTTDIAIKGTGIAVSTGKGVWDITKTAGKATATLVRASGVVESGFIPFKAAFLQEAYMTGLPFTVTSQKIIGAKNALIKTGRTIKTGFVTATNAVKRNYYLVCGVVNGTIMTSVVAHYALQRAGELGLKGLKLTTQGTARVLVKGGVWTVKRGIPYAAKGASGLSTSVAGALTSSDDMMLQGAGYTINLANIGIKTGVTTIRTTGHVVKTSVKGLINTKKTINFIRKNGWRAAWAKAKSAIANAGKSAVTAIIDLVKSLGSKVIVPLILIVVVVLGFSGLISAPVAAIGGIFSGLFDKKNDDGSYTETDIREYIIDPTYGVPAKRTQYINDLYNYMQNKLQANGGSFDYVRLKTNTQDEVVEPTIAGITSIFYTEEDLINVIQPIFNAVILKNYQLAPTDAQARSVFNEIFNKLFRTEETWVVEYCGQSAVDGSGTPALHTCGSVHAAAGCPNPVSGTHTVYTCSTCCYYYCAGHKGIQNCGKSEHTHTSSCYGYVCGKQHTNPFAANYHLFQSSCWGLLCTEEEHTHTEWTSETSAGCYTTTYCSGCIAACNGYTNCMGHNVLTITLNMDGLYQLVYQYFEEPIDALASTPNRTEDQEEELSNLMDSYEICLELIKQISLEYGGGLTTEDLAGVVWVNGSRSGNQTIINIALSQVGQVGGQPFWSWYGYSTRVEWCACFLSWCMNQVGHGEVKFSSCHYGGMPYFQGISQWVNGGYTDLAAGDVIFFDWQGDGVVDHTGLVIGTDGSYVYTVEGNSGDTCKIKKYSISTSVIIGYGIMYW